ncbi:hypothetical protein [Cronobacter malonaticus]|uniref:hypothetical protein n=1 Tax=Cronobacter malonaticus TaxID=413503 RepID=UPI00289458C5|nr:hypothetical protein [Cronobacter malonaticus]MDT3623903.1 hypothetical protein [Cronobacter malonaticus]
MNKLNVEWMPEFGSIYTWFAADKYGRVSLMLNNCFGDLPKSLLCIDNFEALLDSMSEFVWEESSDYSTYPADKCAILRWIYSQHGASGRISIKNM